MFCALLVQGTKKRLTTINNYIFFSLGSKPGTSKINCNVCRGMGVKINLRQIAPGMVQQIQQVCPSCQGQRTVLRDSDRCSECNGQTIQRVKKDLEIYVEKGVVDGHRIVFERESDQAPGMEPGNVIFSIVQKTHNRFVRKGNDLFLKKNITLNEALCGFQFYIEHLDQRYLSIKSESGQIIKPNDVRCVYGEGMPILNSMTKGNLYITFDVEFPENYFLKPEVLEILSSLLPSKPQTPVPSDQNVQNVTMSSRNVLPSNVNYNQQNQQNQQQEQQQESYSGQSRCTQQ